MNTSRRWMNLMRFSLNVAVSLQTIWIRSERTPFSNGGHSTTRNRSKLAQKGSAKPFMRKAYYTPNLSTLPFRQRRAGRRVVYSAAAGTGKGEGRVRVGSEREGKGWELARARARTRGGGGGGPACQRARGPEGSRVPERQRAGEWAASGQRAVGARATAAATTGRAGNRLLVISRCLKGGMRSVYWHGLPSPPRVPQAIHDSRSAGAGGSDGDVITPGAARQHAPAHCSHRRRCPWAVRPPRGSGVAA